MSLHHSFKLFRNQSPVRCEGPGFELFSVVLYLLTSHKELVGTLTKSPHPTSFVCKQIQFNIYFETTSA